MGNDSIADISFTTSTDEKEMAGICAEGTLPNASKLAAPLLVPT